MLPLATWQPLIHTLNEYMQITMHDYWKYAIAAYTSRNTMTHIRENTLGSILLLGDTYLKQPYKAQF